MHIFAFLLIALLQPPSTPYQDSVEQVQTQESSSAPQHTEKKDGIPTSVYCDSAGTGC